MSDEAARQVTRRKGEERRQMALDPNTITREEEVRRDLIRALLRVRAALVRVKRNAAKLDAVADKLEQSRSKLSATAE
jgi:hypothetical protein